MTAAMVDILLIAESTAELQALSALCLSPGAVLQYAREHNWRPTRNHEAVAFWDELERQDLLATDSDERLNLVFGIAQNMNFPWMKYFPRERSAEVGKEKINECRALRAGAIAMEYIQKNEILLEHFRNNPEVFNASTD